MYIVSYFFFFFFQAEDGIRDVAVTGVQTCALPISRAAAAAEISGIEDRVTLWVQTDDEDLFAPSGSHAANDVSIARRIDPDARPPGNVGVAKRGISSVRQKWVYDERPPPVVISDFKAELIPSFEHVPTLDELTIVDRRSNTRDRLPIVRSVLRIVSNDLVDSWLAETHLSPAEGGNEIAIAVDPQPPAPGCLWPAAFLLRI